ncbi:MAG: response regulator [Verrucomicrobiota bacterium]
MNILLNEPGHNTTTTMRKKPRYAPLNNLAIASGRARILYVDDDDTLRGLGQQVLGRQGYEVDTAADGWEALAALDKRQYHLLITDHSMPGLTGLELMVKLREAGLSLPIVMTSGVCTAAQVPANVRPAITALLPKPFVVTELLDTVSQILNRKNNLGPAELALNSIVRSFSTAQSYRNWGINE